MNTTHMMSTTHSSTVSLSSDEQTAERQLLDRFARFWMSGAGHRTNYDRFIAATPLARDIELEETIGGAFNGWWVLPQGRKSSLESVILYLHGGCYVMGSAPAFRGFASQIAVRTRIPIFVLEYPLAPEHPFPAAHDAALGAARWLARLGVKQLAIAGDSAGGGLALSTLASMVKATDVPTPTAGLVFSPWTDLSLSGVSMSDPRVNDTLLARDFLSDCAAKYLSGTAARDCVASPLFGVPRGLPPIYIQVGGDELLLDDATRYAFSARQQGAEVRLEVWDGLHHVFQLNVAELESSRIALERAADFLSGHVRR